MQLMKSASLIGLVEAFTLLERIVPPDYQTVIIPIINQTVLACDYVKTKADMVFQKKFGLVEQSLENMSQDVRLAIEMSESDHLQSLTLTSLTHQMFKHCEKLGYGKMDPTAVFLRIRH